MRHAMRMALVAAAMLGGAGVAQADLLLQNKAGQSVRYTVYDGSGQPISGATGCLSADAVRTFGGAEFGRNRALYIQGVLWSRSDCTGSRLSDTGRGSRNLLQEAVNNRKFINFQGRLLLQ